MWWGKDGGGAGTEGLLTVVSRHNFIDLGQDEEVWGRRIYHVLVLRFLRLRVARRGVVP